MKMEEEEEEKQKGGGFEEVIDLTPRANIVAGEGLVTWCGARLVTGVSSLRQTEVPRPVLVRPGDGLTRKHLMAVRLGLTR